MDATLSSNSINLRAKKMMEEFFKDYPAQKAERLFWHWFNACMQNDFSQISQKDLQEFLNLFDRLHQLELAMQLVAQKAIEGTE